MQIDHNWYSILQIVLHGSGCVRIANRIVEATFYTGKKNLCA